MAPRGLTVEQALRGAYAEALAALGRSTRDLARAEDLLHDAILAALRSWPADGIPDRPAAWLATVGRNRHRDAWRRERVQERFAALHVDHAPTPVRWHDDVLPLLATVCAPELGASDRVILALHSLLGLTTREVATAFLARPSAMERRITRARARLAETGEGFTIPDDVADRLPSMRDAVHALFTEGHWASADGPPLRRQLCDLAESIARSLAAHDAEGRALLALILLHRARLPARWRDGAPVPLPDQDRGLWDRAVHAQGLAMLGDEPGPYALEAHVVATHMAAPSAEATDWGRIAALYAALEDFRPTAVVRVNRAFAEAQARGPEHGLTLLEPILGDKALQDYAYLHLVRGELLGRLGRRAEAVDALRRAEALARNTVEAQQIAARAGGSARPGVGRASRTDRRAPRSSQSPDGVADVGAGHEGTASGGDDAVGQGHPASAPRLDQLAGAAADDDPDVGPPDG